MNTRQRIEVHAFGLLGTITLIALTAISIYMGLYPP